MIFRNGLYGAILECPMGIKSLRWNLSLSSKLSLHVGLNKSEIRFWNPLPPTSFTPAVMKVSTIYLFNPHFSVEMWLADEKKDKFCLKVFSKTATGRNHLKTSNIRARVEPSDRVGFFLKIRLVMPQLLKTFHVFGTFSIKRDPLLLTAPNSFPPALCVTSSRLVHAPLTVRAEFWDRSRQYYYITDVYIYSRNLRQHTVSEK